MKMLNAIEQAKTASPKAKQECFGILVRVLYPVVPHITFQLWEELGYSQAQGPILDAAWPEVDETALIQNEITLMLQVNGKLRGQIQVPSDASKEQIEQLAKDSEAAQKALAGASPKKIIVVPGRLVNIVA